MSNFKTTPFTLPVYDLMHRSGEMREHQLDITVPEGFGTALIGIADNAPMHLDVRLEALHDGILVSADVRSGASGECGRCLDPIELPVEVDFAELFAYSVDEAFDYAVVEDHIDLEPSVRDAVVLSLPFQPVCRPDCPGLDPVTGEKLADFPDREPQVATDPRWSALAGFQSSESDVAGATAGDADSAEREKRS